ncbi:MAG: DNA polymerase III subunit gamma/tau [Planctomycetota bacterium]|nr:DNA polymerase III subunit gamma/tau [Planctomycetota bacterium]MEC7497350.1 DNA polymerase III subunit gamma/tau [Planctomycetota bacterium]
MMGSGGAMCSCVLLDSYNMSVKVDPLDQPSSPSESGQEYVVVARRYRPTRFEELIGQGQVALALRNAIKTNRVGHAYLFTGARGVGKTSAARIFGKALNCIEGPTAEPCNQCDVCLSVAAGEDVDVMEIDGASNRGIEEIRQLRSNVNVRPSRARFKIYIIDEVHMLTIPAFNALLKTLEEPPEHVKFIFCTTDPEKMPITVLSRCQRFDFPPVGTQDIQGRLREIALQEGVEIDDDAIAVLARRAAGSMRDSQSLLEQLLSFGGKHITNADVHRLLGTADGSCLIEIFDGVVNRDVGKTLTEVDRALKSGVDSGQLAEQLLGVLRDVMVLANGGGQELLLSQLAGDYDRLMSISTRLGALNAMAAMQILDQSISRMRQTMHARTLLEMGLVRICGLGDLDSVDRLVRQLAAGQPISPSAKAVTSRPPSKLVDAQPATQGETPSPTPPVQPGPKAEASPQPMDSASVDSTATDPVKKKSTSPQNQASSPASTAALTAKRGGEIWSQALDRLQDTTSEFARDYSSVAISGPNTLVVTLRSSYNKEMCEQPERRKRLEMAVAEVAEQTLQVVFRATQAVAETPTRPATSNRRQLMREITQHPWVNEAIAMFEGEVVDMRIRRSSS